MGGREIKWKRPCDGRGRECKKEGERIAMRARNWEG